MIVEAIAETTAEGRHLQWWNLRRSHCAFRKFDVRITSFCTEKAYMKNSKIVLCIGSSLVAAALGSVALNAQAWPIVIQPSINIGIPAPVVVAPAPVYVAPAPAPVYVEPAPVVAYVPGPFDVFVTAAAPADIVFIGGATYIWSVDAYGHRERHLYGYGDRRAELFHRQEELHRVAARNGGHLPPRGESREEAMAHEQARMASAGRPGGPAPGYHGGPAPQQQQQRGNERGGNEQHGGNEHGGHEHER
jgi:hypothetical protein